MKLMSHPISRGPRYFGLLAATLFALALSEPRTVSAASVPGSQPSGSGNSASVQRHPDPVAASVDDAIAHYTDGNFEMAERLLTTLAATESLPRSVRTLVLFNRGAARLQLNRFEAAITDFEDAARLDFPKPAQLFLAKGVAWEYLDRPDMAAEAFVDALSADPNDPVVQAKIRDFFNKP